MYAAAWFVQHMQGEPVLLEPLPVLLTCARRLASAQPAAASGDWNTGTAENSSSALQVEPIDPLSVQSLASF